MAHPRSVETIEQIAEVLSHFDVVGLQEVDGGSLRSRNMNQLVHLASMADFPFWHQQLNRNLGRLGQFSNGFLSRHQPFEITDHRLPGLPGRGAIVIKYGHPIQPLVVVVAHLALGEKVRNTQLSYLARLLAEYKYVVMMGDFNCRLTWINLRWPSWGCRRCRRITSTRTLVGRRTAISITSCCRRIWKAGTPVY